MNAVLRLRSFGARIARSLFGAALSAAVIAVVDTSWAKSAAGESAKRSGFAIYLADAGLLAPLALLLGLAAALAGLVVDADYPPTPSRLAAALRARGVGRPADVAAAVPLVLLGSFFWMTLSAHLARALLAIEVAPGLAGAAIGIGALGLAFLVALALLALMPSLRHALATASDLRRGWVDPVFTGAVALFLAGALFAFGVATGTVSGEGGFFGIYGIFKRPELDLRAPFEALVITLGGLFAPAVAARLRGLLALLLALLPLALTARAARSLDEAPAVAQALSRSAPMGGPALTLVRRLSDRDGDGMSGRFGGGDCNDRDPKVNPQASEIADNGIDEDCNGSDLSLAAIQKLAPPTGASTPTPTASGSASAPKVPVSTLPRDLNVILITIDTLRADLGYAGNPRPLSPNLDKLAQESVVFDRAYALASYTGKSVGPMLIGKYGSETHRNWGHSNFFTREDTFVAERLKKGGIHTLSAHALPYFGRGTGLERGFEKVDLSAVPMEGSIKEMENTVTGHKLTAAALKLLAMPEHTGRRFFFWMHYLDVHADYLPHEGGPSFGTSQRDLYDGEIAFVDKNIGRVMEQIAASPWGSKTAVIITSDHGEAFGEHDKMYRHGAELWEELVRVPLIIKVPGVPPKRIATRRSAIDLAPTLLELMGVPAPEPSTTGNDFLSGVSLVPDLLLAPGVSPEPRDVLIDMPAGPYNDSRRSLIRGDLKLTVSNGTSYELYDLASDPEERQNLWVDESPQKKQIAPFYDLAKARLREIRVTGERK